MPRIIFYNDAQIFGGHEVMTLHIVESLLSSGNVLSFMYYVGNSRLHAELIHLAQKFEHKLILVPVNVRSGHMQGVMSFFQWYSLFKLYKLLRGKFDLICASQGDIEISSRVLLVAKLAQIKLVSYIPGDFMPFELGLPLSNVRNFFAKILYKMPNKFITISNFFASGLIRRSGLSIEDIHVIENAVKFEHHNQTSEKLSVIYPVLGMIGEINKRKNQQFVIEWLRLNPQFNGVVHMVGDGPLMMSIEQQIISYNLCNKVKLLGWCDNTAELMSCMDVLLIPSLVEGVPLVMLEASMMRIPILATDGFGMADLLPPEMRFRLNDYDDFSLKLTDLLQKKEFTTRMVADNYRRVKINNSFLHFKDRTVKVFTKIIADLL